MKASIDLSSNLKSTEILEILKKQCESMPLHQSFSLKSDVIPT